MADIKKSDRQRVLEIVLERSFSKRFNDLKGRLKEHARNWVKENHPDFIRLLEIPEFSKYVGRYNVSKFTINSPEGRVTAIYWPIYGNDKGINVPTSNPYGYCPHYINATCSEVSLPVGTSGTAIKVSDETLTEEYFAVWKDYSTAFRKLSGVLNGYTMRSKLKEDFPELASLLPKLPAKASLPMVIASQVKSDLQKSGVVLS